MQRAHLTRKGSCRTVFPLCHGRLGKYNQAERIIFFNILHFRIYQIMPHFPWRLGTHGDKRGEQEKARKEL